jgi:hypothetical protein
MERFNPGQVLDALDGVAYATDLDGRIIGVGAESWAEGARANNWSPPAPESLIGRSLFDVISEGEVRSVYLRLHEAVTNGLKRRVMFTCRCDSPDAAREMRMSIGCLRDGAGICAVLYHSQIITQRERPPIPFLDPDEAIKMMRDDTRAILRVCSFCQKVSRPGADNWMTAEVYYRSGGDSDVRLSHGVCNECEANLFEQPSSGVCNPAPRAEGGR